MECSIKDCEWTNDCLIRELIKKDPPKEGCSYHRKQKRKAKAKEA